MNRGNETGDNGAPALKVVPFEPYVDTDVILVLERAMELAKRGQLADFVLGYYNPLEQCSTVYTARPNCAMRQCGIGSRINHALQLKMDETAYYYSPGDEPGDGDE